MYDIRCIQMPDGGGPALQDRLVLASVLNVPFPAAANNVGSISGITAGSGYTYTPTLTPTGGTVTAQVSSGGQITTPLGYQAVLRATMKVVGTPTVPAGFGGSGYVTSDTVAFGNGVILTAATVVSGAVTVWSVAAAGNITNPGALPSVAVPSISTSGVGVGAQANLSWGINQALVDDSGNYSAIPTGVTVTSVDGNGTSGAVSTVGTIGALASLFRQVGPFVNDGIVPSPNFGCTATVNPAIGANSMIAALQAKVTGYAVVRITPIVAAASVTAGTFDAIIWA